MRYSNMFIPTLKETPKDAEISSHKLMLRSGMIRKVAAGIYTLLPIGLKVLRKVENIIREELDEKGAQELFMPAIQPSELWRESERWDEYGKELLRIKDRHNREFCFGPTHEEIVTDIVRKEIKSYKQLPLNLYQIQSKFRDEIRPRFGLMRGREFMMKDAYSFDCDEDKTKESYKKMYEAYTHIFSRCGLLAKAVEAETGTIGGNYSHEFVVMADSGEDEIADCDSCEYAANIEKAHYGIEPESPLLKKINLKEISQVYTPDIKTIEHVSNFLKIDENQLIKTLIFKADENVIVALIRGDYEISQPKLKKALGVKHLDLAKEETVLRITGAPSGFSGPVGLKDIKIIADHSIKYAKNYVVGANEEDSHLKNVNIERDFTVSEFANIRKVVNEDRCPKCSGRLHLRRGIEVGHIFILGEKYSRKLKATFLDENGKEKFLSMGCYGIGVGRTVAAAIEQNHDEYGIIWPYPIAPFEVIILTLNTNKSDVVKRAESIYKSLKDKGIDVLIDDRKDSPGSKFKDADLIGIPVQIIVGTKNLNDNKVEFKIRKNNEKMLVDIEKVEETLGDIMKNL